jgi:hypothetical protein
VETTTQIASQKNSYVAGSFDEDRRNATSTDSDFLSLLLKDKSDSAVSQPEQKKKVDLKEALKDPTLGSSELASIVKQYESSNQKLPGSSSSSAPLKTLEAGLGAVAQSRQLNGQKSLQGNQPTTPEAQLPTTAESQLSIAGSNKALKNAARNCVKGSKIASTASGESRASTKKELYEQSAFAINKLSYLDTLSNKGFISDQQYLASIDSDNLYLIQRPELSKKDAIAPENLNIVLAYNVTAVLNTQEAQGERGPSSLSTVAVSRLQLLEKSRTTLVSDRDGPHLYVRDHFSSPSQVEMSLSSLLETIKFKISKIFINGKER